MFFVKIFLKTTRSHANLNKENNFISCKAKYKKLRDNFPTHFKVTTKHRKRRQFRENTFWKEMCYVHNIFTVNLK